MIITVIKVSTLRCRIEAIQKEGESLKRGHVKDMKKNVAKGILRTWIVFGSLLVFPLSVYIGNRPGWNSVGDGVITFVIGVIVMIIGTPGLWWVLKAFTDVDYDKAISLDPDAADAYCSRAMTKSGLGQHAAAIVDYDKAISLDPDNASAYRSRAMAKSGLGEHAAAIADCDKAISLDPDSASAYCVRGLAKNKIEQNKGAEDLRKALELAEKAGDRNLQRALERSM